MGVLRRWRMELGPDIEVRQPRLIDLGFRLPYPLELDGKCIVLPEVIIWQERQESERGSIEIGTAKLMVVVTNPETGLRLRVVTVPPSHPYSPALTWISRALIMAHPGGYPVLQLGLITHNPSTCSAHH